MDAKPCWKVRFNNQSGQAVLCLDRVLTAFGGGTSYRPTVDSSASIARPLLSPILSSAVGSLGADDPREQELLD